MEIFFPQNVSLFDKKGPYTIEGGKVNGKTVDNCSIISITTLEDLSGVIICWTTDNLVTYQKGDIVPGDLFHSEATADDEKPFTPSLNPVVLF